MFISIGNGSPSSSRFARSRFVRSAPSSLVFIGVYSWLNRMVPSKRSMESRWKQ